MRPARIIMAHERCGNRKSLLAWMWLEQLGTAISSSSDPRALLGKGRSVHILRRTAVFTGTLELIVREVAAVEAETIMTLRPVQVRVWSFRPSISLAYEVDHAKRSDAEIA
ncbi:hypothetical protein NA56DRAFT_751803 [Hyaloscypha hepaticicola]|uniref:Uncharacterized protein n=1 Tax=Hyaloscypha hepaticicola TaxID=2082293 RepID=A0A2J6PVR5_9HELO|nr:hypothetical protein NA56DRAFT_751803 [Hyaloscypha hepaticicola]